MKDNRTLQYTNHMKSDTEITTKSEETAELANIEKKLLSTRDQIKQRTKKKSRKSPNCPGPSILLAPRHFFSACIHHRWIHVNRQIKKRKTWWKPLTQICDTHILLWNRRRNEDKQEKMSAHKMCFSHIRNNPWSNVFFLLSSIPPIAFIQLLWKRKKNEYVGLILTMVSVFFFSFLSIQQRHCPRIYCIASGL